MSYTALPTPDPIVDSEIPETVTPVELSARKSFAKTISAIWRFLVEVGPEDFAGIALEREKVQYKHQHRQIKKKGSASPPMEFTAVEALIDLKTAAEQANWEEAIPLYFYLKRLLGWS